MLISIWFVALATDLLAPDMELASVNDYVAQRRFLVCRTHLAASLFQGCEAVYSSVSGLKAHLGSCTLVCNIFSLLS